MTQPVSSPTDSSPDTALAATPKSPAKRSLAHIKLLADVPTEMLAELEAKCLWREYHPNDIIFELDDVGTDMFFIVRGKLRIIIFSQAAETDGTPHDGSVTLAEMVTGDTFGELAAIDGRPRSARAMALDNCLLATLPSEHFLDLMERCPKVAIALVRRFAHLVRSLNKRVHSLSTLTPTQRIYTELVRLAEPNPQGDGSWLIQNLPPHGDIASWAGADKETVAMAIGQLAREAIVERKHRSLHIRNHARLRLLAHM